MSATAVAALSATVAAAVATVARAGVPDAVAAVVLIAVFSVVGARLVPGLALGGIRLRVLSEIVARRVIGVLATTATGMRGVSKGDGSAGTGC